MGPVMAHEDFRCGAQNLDAIETIADAKIAVGAVSRHVSPAGEEGRASRLGCGCRANPHLMPSCLAPTPHASPAPHPHCSGLYTRCVSRLHRAPPRYPPQYRPEWRGAYVHELKLDGIASRHTYKAVT